MKRFNFSLRVGSVVALAAMVAVPATVRAEMFIDLYGGTSQETSGSITGDHKWQGIPMYYERGDFDGSDSGIGGIRAGYWFKETSWLGIALDMSYFEVDAQSSSMEVDVLPISALLMFRYPLLVSEKFPYGRFYPYVGAGLTFAGVEVTSIYDVGDWDDYDYYDEGGYGYGTDLRAGMNWQITRTVGLFLEYRYISLDLEQNDEETTGRWFNQQYYTSDYDGDLDASFVLGGISFHF
jgi:opacity protein-like surface antigen